MISTTWALEDGQSVEVQGHKVLSGSFEVIELISRAVRGW
jgi:hypothetical protein